MEASPQLFKMKNNYFLRKIAQLLFAGVIAATPNVITAQENVPVKTPVSLEQLLKDVPDIKREDSQAYKDLISLCDQYIRQVSNKIKAEEKIEKTLSDIREVYSKANTIYKNQGLITDTKNIYEALVLANQAENNVRISAFLENIKKEIVMLQQLEPKIQKEKEQVLKFRERFEEIKSLTAKKDYYSASNNISSLIVDLKGFIPEYDAELAYRSKAVKADPNSVNDLKGYAGKSSLENEIKRYNGRNIAPELSKVERVIIDYKNLSRNYEMAAQTKDVDKLLEYDTTLQKMIVIVSSNPYAGNVGLVTDVRAKGDQVLATLRNLSKTKFGLYRSKIMELGKKIDSANISKSEMNRAKEELTQYNDLLKKYRLTLFSSRFMGTEK